ncbi:DUF4179 domain-containing protein [Metasolibacillus meyeri]|uniref:DUF4179 domain-containing protein n=1 Tax=Metasolibacillus meyeri TaxID=1071052 RepID=UPI000D2F88E5|nr:DUF4179 domain-containing protein [Metasolibacillus meyeri]
MKKLYQQFNHLNIDMDLEPMEVSVHEKERIQKRIFKAKKKKYFTKYMATAATFLLATGITVGYAFPAFATNIPIIGNVFSLFVDNDKYIFDNYGQHSTAMGMSQESNGVEVTITNAVYDTENITIAYTIKSDKDLGERPAIQESVVVDEFKEIYEYSGYDRNYIVQKLNDTEYAVIYVYQLIEGTKPEQVHVKFQGDEIRDLNNVNNVVAGDWSFEFTLETLESESQIFQKDSLKIEAEGVEVAVLKSTKTPIATTFYMSELVDEALLAQEYDKVRLASIEYRVTDDVGNHYNFIHHRGTSHSTDFGEFHMNYPRITLPAFDEKATSITITPIVGVYKVKNDAIEGEVVPVKESFEIAPIQIPVK